MGKCERNFFETEAFRDQQKLWYDRLREDGFNDHEKLYKGTLALIHSSFYPVRNINSHIEYENRLQYYYFISQRVLDEPFESKKEKLIMLWHSEGSTGVEINQKLKDAGLRSHRMDIIHTIRKFELKWKIRHWCPAKLRRPRPPTK